MLFNSFTFLIFLAIVILISRVIKSWTIRKGFLLLVSYVFYAAWNPPFVILLWISTICDWYFAKWMHKTSSGKKRKLFLFASLGVNLGMLAYFKYAGFMMDSFASLVQIFGWEYHSTNLGIILPVGISFYTFQTLSYTIDVYRKVSKPWGSFLDYALYVTFFPQLVAGPIVRASDFLPQCTAPKKATTRQLSWGLSLLIIGLFNKVVIADKMLAGTAQRVFDGQQTHGFLDAWCGTLAFTVQIFCDFAGYSTCAIGVALCLGFVLPDNFRFPYAALGFSDFWKRWHISLSTWLRDYLYIPLGGNRKGKIFTYRNLFLTMILGGLWHGASWTFVIWGLLHGAYLVIERLLVKAFAENHFWKTSLAKIFIGTLTMLAVCIAWVFFRAQSLQQAISIVEAMFGKNGIGTLKSLKPDKVFPIFAGTVLLHWFMRNKSLEDIANKTNPVIRGVALSIMAYVIFMRLSRSTDNSFLYFQF